MNIKIDGQRRDGHHQSGVDFDTAAIVVAEYG
jgi:hypothetical protein